MYSSADLLTLRREATDALRAVQRLPGFAERIASLPRLPTELAHWPWWSVLRVCHGHPPGTVLWTWLPADLVEAGDRVTYDTELARRFGTALAAKARETGRSKVEEGQELLHVPADEPPPADDMLLTAIEDYRLNVESLAAEYLFNAQWSARALHDALRLGREVLLPPARPRPQLVARTDLRVDVTSGSLLDLSAVEALRAALDGLEQDPRWEELRKEWTEVRRAARATLRGAEARAPAMRELREALERLDELDSLESTTPEKLSPGGRDTMWSGAIRAVRCRLESRAVPDKERKHYERARRHLDAAVNGTTHPGPPAELTDARDYFNELRRAYTKALRALMAAQQLAERATP